MLNVYNEGRDGSMQWRIHGMRLLAVLAAMLFMCGAQAEGLADGEYVPDSFSFSGGSGKVTIECPSVRVEAGQAWATLVFSSPNYPALRVDGISYTAAHDGDTSAFEVPVALNAEMEIVGTTTAMSKPHDITYMVRVGLGAGEEEAPAEAVGGAEETAVAETAASVGPVPGEPLAGLAWVSSLPLRYAEGFSVHYYEGGYARIDIADGDSMLVVPEGMEPPEGLDPGILVLKRPLDNIYLAATSAMALFDRLDALDAIRLSSLEASGWSVANAAAAMESGEMQFAGKYSEPDYELLLRTGCDLAIESTMIFHTPKVREMIEQLGIPVIVDRSSYETHPLGHTEWIKLYAVLVGKETEAAAFFDGRAAIIDAYSGYPNTEKTVAFFYVSSDGSVVVRGAGDYVPKMIEIAGGRYALGGIVDPESSRSSVSITMEQFYDAAIDADYLIYNASIASPLGSMDDLMRLSSLFADFRAVREGNVWCTGKDLYQETDDVGELIVDIHNMLTGEGDMRFLTRVE